MQDPEKEIVQEVRRCDRARAADSRSRCGNQMPHHLPV